MSLSPFQVGHRYVVKCDFTALRDRFVRGTVLTYSSSAWSRYDGITGYFFLDEEARSRVWDIEDGADLSGWVDFFDPLP